MKRMTNAQINEINELLKTHGEALTAFYNEGICYGMKSGLKWTFGGIVIGIALEVATDIIKRIRNKRNVEEEP